MILGLAAEDALPGVVLLLVGHAMIRHRLSLLLDAPERVVALRFRAGQGWHLRLANGVDRRGSLLGEPRSWHALSLLTIKDSEGVIHELLLCSLNCSREELHRLFLLLRYSSQADLFAPAR